MYYNNETECRNSGFNGRGIQELFTEVFTGITESTERKSENELLSDYGCKNYEPG